MKEYIVPRLWSEVIVPDTAVSSCVSGKCGLTGNERVACAEKEAMPPYTYRQDDSQNYTFCVDYDFVCK